MGKSPYGHRYKTIRAALLGQPCALQLVCEGDPADSADHSPPLSRHEHIEGSNCCALRPACMRCQGEQAKMLSMETKRRNRIKRGDIRSVTIGGHDVTDLVQSVEWS